MQPVAFPVNRDFSDPSDASEQLVHVVTSPVEGCAVMGLLVGGSGAQQQSSTNTNNTASAGVADDPVSFAASYIGQHDRRGNRHGLGVLAIKPPVSVGVVPPAGPTSTLPAMPSGLMPSDVHTPSSPSDGFNSRAERAKGIRQGGDTAFFCQWDRDLALLSAQDADPHYAATVAAHGANESRTLPVVLVQGGMRQKLTAFNTLDASPNASTSAASPAPASDAADSNAPLAEGRSYVPTSLYVGEASLLSGGAMSRGRLQGLEWAHKKLRVLPHGVGMTSTVQTDGVSAKGGDEALLKGNKARLLKRGASGALGGYGRGRGSMAGMENASCYIGEHELGECTGFGVEIDFSNTPSHKPGGGGGVTADTLVSGSNPEAALSGELGASSDCPSCMCTRSAPPLCDVSLPRRTMPSYEQHPIGYIGPFHTDAREGSGMLYRYGGAPQGYGAAPPPPILISGLWKDGQMVTQPSAGPGVRQLAHSIDVTLLRTSHRLCGNGWTFDSRSIGFKQMTMTNPKGSSRQRHTDGIWESLLRQLDQHLSNATMGLGDEDEGGSNSKPMTSADPAPASSSGGGGGDEELMSPPTMAEQQRLNDAKGKLLSDVTETFAVVTPRSRLWRALAKAIRKEAFVNLLATFQHLFYKLHMGQHELPATEAAFSDPFVKAVRRLSPQQQSVGGGSSKTPSSSLKIDDEQIHRDAVALSSVGAFVPQVEAEVMFTPQRVASIPSAIPSPQHFEGGPSIPSLSPQVPTIASFLRACDELTAFVVSLRFRLMSLVAAANIQSQLYGHYAKSLRVAGNAADLFDDPQWVKAHVSTMREILTGPESGKGQAAAATVQNATKGGGGGAGAASGGLSTASAASSSVCPPLLARPSAGRVGAIAATLHQATVLRAKGCEESVDLEYSDEVLFYAWDLLFPIGAPLLESLAAATFEARCWIADLELTANRLQVPTAAEGGLKLKGSRAILAALPYATRAVALYEDNYEVMISHIVGKALDQSPASRPKKDDSASSVNSLTRLEAAVREFAEVFLGEGDTDSNVSAYAVANASVGTRVSIASKRTLEREGQLRRVSLDSGTSPIANSSIASYPLFAGVRDGRGEEEVSARPSAPAPSLSRCLSTLQELRAAVTEASLEQAQKLLKHCRAMRDGNNRKDKKKEGMTDMPQDEKAAVKKDPLSSEAALTQQLLLERQFTEGLAQGAMTILLPRLCQQGWNSGVGAAKKHSLRTDVEATRHRIRRMLSKLLVMDQITRKGIVPTTQAASTHMPHMVRVGLRISTDCGEGAAEGGGQRRTFLGRVEYDERVDLGVVASFFETLELCRSRGEVLGNRCAPIPTLTNRAAPNQSLAAGGDPVERALRHFASLVPKAGDDKDVPYPTTLNRTGNPLLRVTEFTPLPPPFFVSRASDMRPCTTAANLSGTLPTATSTPQILTWRLFDWLATGRPSTSAAGHQPPPPTLPSAASSATAPPFIAPPTVPSVAAAAGLSEEPIDFSEATKTSRKKKHSSNTANVPIPLQIAVATSHTVANSQPSPRTTSQEASIVQSAPITDTTLWLASCAASTIITAHRHNGPHHPAGSDQTPSSKKIPFDARLAIIDAKGNVITADTKEEEGGTIASSPIPARNAPAVPQYRPLPSEGFALRANEMLLKPQMATEIAVESVVGRVSAAAGEPSTKEGSDNNANIAASSIAVPSYAVVNKDLAAAAGSGMCTPVAAPSNASTAQLHAACRVLGALGKLNVSLDSKTAKITRLKKRRLIPLPQNAKPADGEAAAGDLLSAISSEATSRQASPNPSQPMSLSGSHTTNNIASSANVNAPVRNKAVAAAFFGSSSSSDDDAPRKGGGGGSTLRAMGSARLADNHCSAARSSSSSSSSDSSDGGGFGNRLASVASRNNVSFAGGGGSMSMAGGGAAAGGGGKYYVLSASFDDTAAIKRDVSVNDLNCAASSSRGGVGGGSGLLSSCTQKALEMELLAAIHRENESRICNL